MRRSPSSLLSLSKLLTINLSTTKLSTHSSRTSCFLAILIACLFVIVSPLLAQQAPVLVTQAVDNSVRTVLPGNVHPLARAEFDQGEAPLDMPLHRMLLVLKRSDQQETALRHLIENQQYKKSPSYHRWLTPEEFGAQFGPSDSDIAAVTNWLLASGFQVTQVTKGRTVIEFSGTAGQVKQAFGTAIHKYVVQGEQHWANASNPSIPTALVPVVVGVNSLHNFLKKAQNVRVGTYSEKTKQVTSPQPNFTFNGGCVIDNTRNCYALAPYDFATIYDLLPLWNATPTPINGTGQTIAIVGRTDINPNDATTFWSLFGLDGVNAPQPTLKITTNGPDPGFTGDEPEADIDTQWSGAAAPGATINFVTSASTETSDGVDLSALYIVDNNLAPIMSESYGNCEASLGNAGVNFYGGLWEQAAAQGITAMVSTGDNGSAGCDDPNTASAAQNGLAVNGLASTPWNVAVGGTDFAQFTTPPSTYWNSTNAPITQESAKGYIPETTWNDSCANPLFQFVQGGSTNPETNCNNSQLGFLDIVGGSGGKSAAWTKPPWQTGTGVPNDNARDLPDVSLFASSGFLGSFYVICQADQTGGVCDLNNFLGFGGTSVSSPAFAGIMALVNQKMGSAQGNANFVLYKLVAKTGVNAFHDVPSGSTIAMPCLKGSPNCTTSNSAHTYGILSGYGTTTNYDLATGLGSVDAANLVNNWNKVTFTPSTTTLTINSGNPVNVTHGTSVPVTIGVTPASPTPTGDVALLVSPKPGTPSIDGFTLTNGAVNGTTHLLPGGTYQVIAHYEGDSTYGGSYSAPSASITVNPETSFVYMPGVVVGTDLNGNPVYSTSVVYGTGGFSLWETVCSFQSNCAYWLRADVKNAVPSFCTTETLGEIACPTGTVVFTDNGSPLDGGNFKLNSFGYTQDQGIQLTGTPTGVPPHTLVATYSGDNSYLGSSASVTITVTPATTSISNVTAPATANTGQNFTVTATVTTSSFGLAPTGAVKFFANATLLGTALTTPTNGNINTGTLASLSASLTTSIPTVGTYAITATYSGDGNYTAVTAGQSNSVNIVVSPPPTPFTWTNTGSTSHTVLSGQTTSAYTFTATPSGGTFAVDVNLACPSGLPDATVACVFYITGQTTPITKIAAGSGTTNITLTITTTGPNAGTGALLRRKADNHAPWLPLALPLAGIVMVGFAGRKMSKHSAIAGLCVSLALLGLLVACGGGSHPPVAVSVSQGSPSSLFPNGPTGDGWPAQTAQFTATVTNTSNTAVTWAVTGGSANGTIDANGKYTAPTVAAGLPASVTITATSQADSTEFGQAQETLKAATIPGTYNNIMVTATEGTVGAIVNSDPVTLVVQ